MHDLNTIEALAQRLAMTPSDLVSLAERAPVLYRWWKKPKKSGKGMRTIESPDPALMKVQRLLLDLVLMSVSVPDTMFGSKGRGTIQAARRHVRKPLVVVMDIADFFPSISIRQVIDALVRSGAQRDVAKFLARLMTFDGHLATGAPTSTRMAMIVAAPALIDIQKALSTIPNADLSIWVDDTTISGPIGLKRMLPTIRRIFSRHGLKVHPEKQKEMPRTQEQVTLGIKVNDRIALPESYRLKFDREGAILPPLHPKRRGMERYMEALEKAY